MKNKNRFTSLIFIVLFQFSFSQKKDETIGSEVVNVVKPYSATISDAFKVNEIPSLDDDETAKKEIITYSIFSFPVASTFTPSKGKAAGVEKSVQEKYFSNYASLAGGNYGNINAELYLTHLFESNNYIAASLKHLSSQGGIKDILLDDFYYNTALEINYGKKGKQLSWNTAVGYQNQIYNWYGFQPLVMPLTNSAVFLDNVIEKQNYNSIYLGANLALNDSFFKEMDLKFYNFSDGFKSAENHFYLKPVFNFDFLNEKVKTVFIFDYLKGSFERGYNDPAAINYATTNIGFNPSFNINDDNLSVNLGATFFYSMDNQNNKNKFFIYPSITASFNVVNDIMIAFAGAEGTLKQNSYRQYVDQNNFLAPTLYIAPTDSKYDVYIGLKGKLDNAVSYTLKASYLNEDYKPLFIANSYSSFNTNTAGYTFGNSFNIITDNVKTWSFFAELKADLSQNVTFGINGTLFNYSLENQSQPWNLPSLKLESNFKFKFSPKWNAGFNVFYVGERKDQQEFTLDGITSTIEEVNLDSYLDLNTFVNYKHSDRLTFFIKGNNLTNQNYQKWFSFPVQGIQVLLGANFKFDF